MSDFVHGHMDISSHKETWDGFCRLVKWSAIGIAVLLIFLIPYLVS